MTWSAEARRLLIWNLEDGVDVFRLHDDGQIRHQRKLGVSIKRNFVKITDLVQHGQMAVSGTDKGELNVWDAETGVVAQTLIHGSGECAEYMCTSSPLRLMLFRDRYCADCRRMFRFLFMGGAC